MEAERVGACGDMHRGVRSPKGAPCRYPKPSAAARVATSVALHGISLAGRSVEIQNALNNHVQKIWFGENITKIVFLYMLCEAHNNSTRRTSKAQDLYLSVSEACRSVVAFH